MSPRSTKFTQYPAPVHQYLSPNDNKIHGCKSKWYLEYESLDTVERSLRLMQLLDEEMELNSARYFKENIFLLKRSQCPLIIANKKVELGRLVVFNNPASDELDEEE